MAFLGQDDKELDPNQPQDGTQAAPAGAPLSNSGGAIVSSGQPVSTAGVGAGGTGGWTNIQSYLTANQGTKGSADALNKEVGSAFDTESKNVQDQAEKSKSDAKTALTQNKLGQDEASKLIEDAGSQYSYSTPNQNDAYKQDLSKIQGALSTAYQGPSYFNYALGGQAQDYGTNLANDQGFQSLMQGVYNKSANGQIGSGGLALQQQLDQDNPYVNQSRQNLLQKYAGLSSLVDQTGKDTQAVLDDSKNQFASNQNGLKSYLSDQGNSYNAAMNDAVKRFAAEEEAIKTSGPVQNRTSYSSNPISPDASLNPYYKYEAGHAADLNNIGGVETERNRYNAIMEALGMPTDRIMPSGAPATHGTRYVDDEVSRNYFRDHPYNF